MRRLFLFALALTVVVPLVVVVVTMVALAQADCGNGTPTGVTAPSGSVQTMGEMVRYLESQSIPAVDGAGIVGNLMQESGLNPIETGYGLAQWTPSWWALVSAWISAHGQNPNTAGGQLMYIAANVNQDVDGEQFYAGLRSDLAHASSPQQAALVWMNDYEQCQGAGPRGSLSFTPGSLCMAEQRESYAVQALQAAGGSQRGGGSALLVSATPNGACNASLSADRQHQGLHEPVREGDRAGVGAHRPGRRRRDAAGLAAVGVRPEQGRDDRPRLLRGTAGDRVRDHGRAAGRQVVVPVRADPADRQSRPDGSRPGRRSRRTRRRAPASRSAGGRRAAATRSGHAGYEEGLATNAGGDFRYLLQALGANPGTGAGMSSGPTMGNTYYPTGNPGP